MASDDTMMTVLSSMQDEEFDEIDDDGYDHQLLQHHNLSRLSMCTSSMYTNEDDDDDEEEDEGMKIYMSRLSIESFDGDADEEFSDEKEFKGLAELSSDSDKEPGYYSLPETPSRRGDHHRGCISYQLMGVKDYGSENEVEEGMMLRSKNLRKRRIVNSNMDDVNKRDGGSSNELGFSGESDQSGGCGGSGGRGGGGVVVITRPKGGSRSLCMGLEEVKACRDLGFELEHERMVEIPNRVSLSGSTTLDTSSGGNSPIANWRISSPGDDPRDVKARLKMWAQAVALASTSR